MATGTWMAKTTAMSSALVDDIVIEGGEPYSRDDPRSSDNERSLTQR